jgi:hypothetical protein
LIRFKVKENAVRLVPEGERFSQREEVMAVVAIAADAAPKRQRVLPAASPLSQAD